MKALTVKRKFSMFYMLFFITFFKLVILNGIFYIYMAAKENIKMYESALKAALRHIL